MYCSGMSVGCWLLIKGNFFPLNLNIRKKGRRYSMNIICINLRAFHEKEKFTRINCFIILEKNFNYSQWICSLCEWAKEMRRLMNAFKNFINSCKYCYYFFFWSIKYFEIPIMLLVLIFLFMFFCCCLIFRADVATWWVWITGWCGMQMNYSENCRQIFFILWINADLMDSWINFWVNYCLI